MLLAGINMRLCQKTFLQNFHSDSYKIVDLGSSPSTPSEEKTRRSCYICKHKKSFAWVSSQRLKLPKALLKQSSFLKKIVIKHTEKVKRSYAGNSYA